MECVPAHLQPIAEEGTRYGAEEKQRKGQKAGTSESEAAESQHQKHQNQRNTAKCKETEGKTGLDKLRKVGKS